MKNKRTFTAASILFAVAAIAGFAIFRYTPGVHAQNPPPAPDRVRTAFGMLGIASGQTMRFTVSNTIMPNDPNLPPDPCRVVLNFRNLNGNLVRDGRGDVIRRAQTLERGDSTFLDVNYNDVQPGTPRLQLRAVIYESAPPEPDIPPPCRLASSVEVINNANGRTEFAVTGFPVTQRLANPPEPE